MMLVAALVVLALAACGSRGEPTPPTVAATPGSTATPGSSGSAVPSASTPTPAGPAAPSGAPATAQATPRGPLQLCSLLTTDALHTVLGGSWREGQLTSTASACHWDRGGPSDQQVVTMTDARSLNSITAATPDGTVMAVEGLRGFGVRQAAAHLFTIYVDIGGELLVVEFGTSSSAGKDLEHAQTLAEVVIGNL